MSTPAASLAKRKSPVHDAACNDSVETNSKKQNLGLTCTVCSITATAEKVMKDHLNGKNHKKKVAALAAQPATKPEPHEAKEEDALLMAASGDFKPTKFTMMTNAGMLNDVTQMDGYLLCEVCNVRTTDRVTMMCHLEGAKHISKAQRPPALREKCVNGQHAPETAVASTDGGGGPDTVVLEVEGELHTVHRQGGSSLLCERCAVRAPSERSMRLHLLGRKHKTKVDVCSVASASGANRGMEAAKAQENEKGTSGIEETASQQMKEAPPLAKAMQENTGTMATSSVNKEVVTVQSSEAPGKEAEKVSIGAPAAVAITVNDSDLVMEVDGVRHPLTRVEGVLLCPCCDVKATSEVVMRSHLAGKKHKNKMTSTAKTAERMKVPKMAKSAGEANLEPATTVEAKKAAAGAAADVVPMELDAPGAVITRTEPADGITRLAGKPVTIYVDGRMTTVLLQENGRMSCELCGVRGIIKDEMLKHLYTRMHWEKASLAEKKEQMAQAAAAALVKDGDGGSLVAEGTAEASGGELIATGGELIATA